MNAQLISLATETDRTLFFDLLPLGFRAPSRLVVRCKLFTVPGQVAHDGTRKAVLSRAECIKVTKNVAFVRMSAYHDDPADPIALGTATYMIGTKGQAVALGAAP